MRRKWWFILAVILQVAVLVTMIGMKWSTLEYGTKIMLKTAPVDPWDVFRGDYVTLNYEICALDTQKITGDAAGFQQNDTVYVTLQQQGKYWEAVAVDKQRPPGAEMVIKGRVNYYDDFAKKLMVTYGIDSYYVPQHEGLKLEQERAEFEVEVSVDRRGNAALAKLFVGGKEVEFQ